jgi:hypothetical protein
MGLLAMLALGACSGGGGASKPDAGAEAGPSSPWTCAQIRKCIFDAPCGDDACVQSCATKGSTAAQASFEALRACTAKICMPVTDTNCACGEQCLADGTCLAEVDACLENALVDPVCDTFCR